jgi:hypothetical protein
VHEESLVAAKEVLLVKTHLKVRSSQVLGLRALHYASSASFHLSLGRASVKHVQMAVLPLGKEQ